MSDDKRTGTDHIRGLTKMIDSYVEDIDAEIAALRQQNIVALWYAICYI